MMSRATSVSAVVQDNDTGKLDFLFQFTVTSAKTGHTLTQPEAYDFTGFNTNVGYGANTGSGSIAGFGFCSTYHQPLCNGDHFAVWRYCSSFRGR